MTERTFRSLAEIIGPEALAKLVQLRAGSRLHIPSPLHLERTPDHWLTFILGRELAMALAHEAGGTQVSIPNNKMDLARENHAAIRAAHQCGLSVRDMVLRYGFTERHIYRILAAGR